MRVRVLFLTPGGSGFGDGYGGGRFGAGRGGGGTGGSGASGGRRFGYDRTEDSDGRLPKINFPMFDGEADPLPWLNKCTMYFRSMGTLAKERVWMASLLLKGPTTEWYYALERDYGVFTWPRFEELVNMRFGPPLRTNGLADLKELRRTDTVDEYQRQFLTLLCRCDDITPRQQVQMFTVGLGEPLRIDVELAAPTELQQAMNLARAYERRISVSTPDTIKGGPKTSKSAPAATSSVAVSSTPRPRFRRLSPEELAAKQANGECYRCPEKYVKGHRCSSKGVFLLEMDDDIKPETAAEELGISLHALTGIDVTNTIQLHVRIKGRTLVALVDTGSTHTFIRDDLLPQLDLILTPRNGLTVKVANGEQVTSGGVCRAADLEIGTEHFSAHLHALSLDCFDIVLGV
jgi:hypothetical protein